MYADGNKIYKLDCSKNIWGNTTGNVWNFVKLPTDVSSIKVRLTACYPEVEGQLKQYYIGDGNDNYGHSAGDAYISNSARVIENIFERFGKCYRIGGDEFCCVIPKAKGFNIQRYIQKLHQDVEILNNKNIIPTEVGIACGYAFVTETDTDIEKVRERADEMMYQNKKELKGLV